MNIPGHPAKMLQRVVEHDQVHGLARDLVVLGQQCAAGFAQLLHVSDLLVESVVDFRI